MYRHYVGALGTRSDSSIKGVHHNHPGDSVVYLLTHRREVGDPGERQRRRVKEKSRGKKTEKRNRRKNKRKKEKDLVEG